MTRLWAWSTENNGFAWIDVATDSLLCMERGKVNVRGGHGQHKVLSPSHLGVGEETHTQEQGGQEIQSQEGSWVNGLPKTTSGKSYLPSFVHPPQVETI